MRWTEGLVKSAIESTWSNLRAGTLVGNVPHSPGNGIAVPYHAVVKGLLMNSADPT